MEREAERNLTILSTIADREGLTQRALSERLGIALGLTNLYLRRLVGKGYVKVLAFPAKPLARKRLRYLLTARGFAEKTRLTAEYMYRSLDLYRATRATLRGALAHLPEQGIRRVALYSTGEAAELSYLTLKEFGLEPIGVFAQAPDRGFLGMPVRDYRDLATIDLDIVIVATFDKPKLHVPALLAIGVPEHKILTLLPWRKPNGTPGRASG